MSGPIQIVPKGLLGALQLKQMGKNPSNLLNDVYPQLDLWPLYTQQLQQDQYALVGGLPQENVAPSPGGNGNHGFSTAFPLTVPQGQMWYVTHYSVAFNLLAAETIRLALNMITDPALSTPVLLSRDFSDVITARARTGAIRVDQPFFAHAGTNLGFVVYDVLTAATINIFANVRAVVMPI